MKLETGNLDILSAENEERRGWFVGSFIPKDSLLNSDSCEVKWSKFLKGLKRTSSQDASDNTHTVAVLIKGKWKCFFTEEKKKVILSEPGDFVAYDGGAHHENEALEDSHLMVIRWRNKE
ncbi:MAG: hypothetical protein ACD_9C00253G0002 [uncultured bacterium]|nr:MAG: hypothetical protein ACD_9C00253G0002 [uncultured bacterium]